MDPALYDAWYDTPRGRWIGEREFLLLKRLLTPRAGETLLDVGSGTGYFSRRFAQAGLQVTGIDSDEANVSYARRLGGVGYQVADAMRLPFAEKSFDLTVSVTALCFIHDARAALAEMARVARRRVVIGLLHRCSLLYLQKGHGGGQGGYAGAHWHTAREVNSLTTGLSLAHPRIRYALFLPSGRYLARWLEPRWPERLPLGAFMAVSLDIL